MKISFTNTTTSTIPISELPIIFSGNALVGLRVANGVLYADLSDGRSLQVNLPATGSAIIPTITTPLIDITVTVNSGDTIVPLNNYFADAESYSVSPTGQGVTISGSTMTVSSSQERNTTYTVTATSSTGHAVTDDFVLDVTAVTSPDSTPIAGALWIGDYDDSSVMVTATGVANDDQVMFAATPASGGSTILTPVLTVDPTYRYVRGELTGLTPGTDYNIELRNQSTGRSQLPGRVRTRPTTRQAFAFAFASCGRHDRHEPIYETIVDDNPDIRLFYHFGDRHYGDINTNDVSRYHSYCNQVMNSSVKARLHRSCAVLYVWDDHDFGPDNSNGNSVVRPAALSYFRNRVPARTHSAVATDSVYRVHEPMPGFKIAILDTRADRYVVADHIISPEQEAWLISLIEEVGATTNGVLGIGFGVPWIAGPTSDTWGMATAQRTRIANAIINYAPGRVFGLAGDMHALAFDDGTNAPGGIPIYHASPLGQTTSTKGGPYSGGVVRATETQYARIDATPTSTGWTINFKGYSVDATGVQTLRMEHIASLNGANAPADTAPTMSSQATISGTSTDTGLLTINSDGIATGTPTPTVLSRQWYLNGTAIPGEIGTTVDKAVYGIGNYYAVVTWSNGVAPDAQSQTNTVAVAASTTPTPTNSVESAIMAHSPLYSLGTIEGDQWLDISGNGRHATIIGAQGTRVTTGPNNMPFFMGGSSAYAEILHNDVDNSIERTQFAWINATENASSPGIYRTGNEKFAMVGGAVGSYQSYWNGSGTSVNTPNGSIPYLEWFFIARTFKDGVSRTYVGRDGVLTLQGERTGTTALTTTEKTGINALISGTSISRSAEFAFSRVSRFNVALTEEQLNTIYQESLT